LINIDIRSLEVSLSSPGTATSQREANIGEKGVYWSISTHLFNVK